MPEFETYRCKGDYIATIGGGVTTDRILEILRLRNFGGYKVDPRITNLITCGEGPCRFFSCHRQYLRPEDAAVSAGTVLEHLRGKQEAITYEVGLRWFATNPTGHLWLRKDRPIAILPAEPLVADGQTLALLFLIAGDSRGISLCPIDLTQPFPPWDFVTARELTPNPFCFCL